MEWELTPESNVPTTLVATIDDGGNDSTSGQCTHTYSGMSISSSTGGFCSSTANDRRLSISSTSWDDIGTWTYKLKVRYTNYSFLDKETTASITVNNCDHNPPGSTSCECSKYKLASVGTDWPDHEWNKPATEGQDEIAAVSLINEYGTLVSTCSIAANAGAAPTKMAQLQVWDDPDWKDVIAEGDTGAIEPYSGWIELDTSFNIDILTGGFNIPQADLPKDYNLRVAYWIDESKWGEADKYFYDSFTLTVVECAPSLTP